MNASTSMEQVSNAPKLHKDRSGYGPALQKWFEGCHPQAGDVRVGGVDIPLATGFSNETVFFNVDWTEDGRTHSERFVARVEPPTGALFPMQTRACSVSVEVQFRAMELVARHGVPMCSLVGFEPDPAILGQPFFVMGFVEGVVPADVPRYSEAGFLVTEATPEQRGRLVRSGLQALARVHAIDWRTAGLEWLDGSASTTPTQAVQLQIYRRFITEQLHGRPHPVLGAALDWLEANDPCDERIGLTWGDSRLGNIIWRDYDAVVVCDWEACALGPTEADVGWWLMFDRMSFDDLGAPRMEGFPTRDQMIAIYEEVSGREVRDPHYWEVFGAMRFDAIMIVLADRMVDAGLVPAAANMAVANAVTEALARLLEIDNPTPTPA
ncbi:MAG: phosphotransferase family protein [Actinomycetota bacterium]|nr:phosphotransferase family protein [Actinomycetota bacterium]